MDGEDKSDAYKPTLEQQNQKQKYKTNKAISMRGLINFQELTSRN